MSHGWYVYTSLPRADAFDVVAELDEHGNGASVFIEVCDWSPPPLADMLEQCADPSGLASRYAKCVSVIRIDRPSDEPAFVAGVRALLTRLQDAVINRGAGILEGAQDVVAGLSARPDVAAQRSDVARAEAALSAFADLADLADMSRPDVAAAAEILALLRSGVGRASAAAEARARVERLSPLGERYLKSLVRFGPLADTDAARVLDVAPGQVATIRSKLREALDGLA